LCGQPSLLVRLLRSSTYGERELLNPLPTKRRML
jgi:hypothetical protein